MSDSTPPSPFGTIAQKVVDNLRPPTPGEAFRAIGVVFVVTMLASPISAYIQTTYAQLLWEWFISNTPPAKKTLFGAFCLANMALAAVSQAIGRFGHPSATKNTIREPWSSTITFVIGGWVSMTIVMLCASFVRLVMGWS